MRTYSFEEPYDFISTSDGLRLRYGVWKTDTPACKGTVLILGGRTEFLEKYLETVHELTLRGFDVFSFDWRGQGLSDRLIADHDKGFVESFDQYLHDLDVVLHQVVYPACKRPLLLLAHSMGAHISLRYLAAYVHEISSGVLTAPMIDISTDPIPALWARRLSRAMVRWGFADRKVIGSGHHNPLKRPFYRNRMTSDTRRFNITQMKVTSNPMLSAGSVTYGWLAAAYNSIDTLQRDKVACNIRIPLLIAVAGCDQVVSNEATIRFGNDISDCETIIIKDSKHEILQERDALRLRLWQAFDRFHERRI